VSTRSRIATRRGPNIIESIYCHFDGYPAGVGATLLEHYKTQEKVDALLALGNLSILREEVGDSVPNPSRFDAHLDPHPTWCLAYGRDRGETGQQAKVTSDMEFAVFCDRSDAEFVYLFDAGTWYFAAGAGRPWVLLTPGAVV
jgi:hypothetical protein